MDTIPVKNEINVQQPQPQLSVPDHDLLIRLDTKMDNLSSTFNQYYTDLIFRVSKLETRADKEDVYHAGIDLVHFRSNSDWVDGFRANWRLIVGVVGGFTAIVGGIISTIVLRWLHL